MMKDTDKDTSISHALFGIPKDRGDAIATTVKDVLNNTFPRRERPVEIHEQWHNMYTELMSISKDELEQKWICIQLGMHLGRMIKEKLSEEDALRAMVANYIQRQTGNE